jgi:hypothetical protein
VTPPTPSTPSRHNAPLTERLPTLDPEPQQKTEVSMANQRNPAQADDERVAILGYN